ncbi:MAG TPA: hypothetical protein VG916_03730 [Gemmatimonadaceae bacterium]|nr:hypothetical protein [Gemmatimonadaceae bacterium]
MTANAPDSSPATRRVQVYASPRLSIIGGIQQFTSAVGTKSMADGGMGMNTRSQ